MSDTPPKDIPGARLRPLAPASASRPVVTPLQPSVVYAAESPDALDAQYEGRVHGYAYAREGHPNADGLARLIDKMEGAEGGLVTGSGMAAIGAALLGVLKAGDHVVAGDQLYGRTLRMLSDDLPRLGISATRVNTCDAGAVAAALRPETRAVLIEIVSNPTLRVADLAGIAALTRARGILLVVDNTFTTPLGLRPFEHGADIVIHSVTKLLAGHSDATLGYVAARDPELRQSIRDRATTWGMTASPYDCWLAERGLYSFELRYERAAATAAALADALAGAGGVEQVLYPTRADHPDHARAAEVLGNRGGTMVTFSVAGGRDAANRLVRALPEVPFAPTLGDIGTTLSHPASSSHRALSPEDRAQLGISEGTFRVSVGVEPAEALVEAFRRAVRASQARIVSRPG